MTVDPVLNGDPSPLIVVPLPHQGRVAGATSVGCTCLGRGSSDGDQYQDQMIMIRIRIRIRTHLVRGSAAERRGQLQQEWEVGEGS